MPDTLTTLQTRLCGVCTRPLRGRSDKKFCNDYCRNTFNNRKKIKSNSAVTKQAWPESVPRTGYSSSGGYSR